MFSNKVKLSKELYKQACEFAEKAGYTSVDEFVAHVVEREVSKLDSAEDDSEKIKQTLQGLGYIS